MSCVDVRRPLHPRSCMQNASTYGAYAVWTGLQDHQRWRHVCSNDCPWDHDLTSTSFAQRTECWPPRVMQFNDYLMRKTDYKTMCFLVCMYYTQPCYQTSIFGKNCAYYIRIFTVGVHSIYVCQFALGPPSTNWHLMYINSLLQCGSPYSSCGKFRQKPRWLQKGNGWSLYWNYDYQNVTQLASDSQNT